MPTFEFLDESGGAGEPSGLLPLAESVADVVDRMLSQFPPSTRLDEDSLRQLTGNILRALAVEASAGRLHYEPSSVPAEMQDTPALLASWRDS